MSRIENGVLVEGREPAELIDAIERVTASASPPTVAGPVAHLEAKRVVPSLLSDLEAQLIRGCTDRYYV